MDRFVYNDISFELEPRERAWDLHRALPGGGRATVGASLFRGLGEEQASSRARALAMAIFPVGIRVVGPDVAHPIRIGDLNIVGPDVTHPNFIRWDKESSSFPEIF